MERKIEQLQNKIDILEEIIEQLQDRIKKIEIKHDEYYCHDCHYIYPKYIPTCDQCERSVCFNCAIEDGRVYYCRRKCCGNRK
jgi:hypothetical protein